MSRVPQGFFRGEQAINLGIPGKTRYLATGEFRAPKRGEYYLSGAIITAYRAPNDLTQVFWIAKPIEGSLLDLFVRTFLEHFLVTQKSTNAAIDEVELKAAVILILKGIQ
jgi:hypothetical protein